MQCRQCAAAMTKLQQWLALLSCLGLAWGTALLTLPRHTPALLLSPLLLLIIFALYSVTTIIYRVATFNDCEVAAREIQTQIKEAKEDLKSRGFDFGDIPEKKTD